MNKKELQRLSKSETYSLLLFALFQMKNNQKYSGLSELIYLLDETSLLNLCKYYGGLTITIPTLDELETLIYALVLYESININGELEEEAIKELKCDSSLKDDIIECYTSLIDILKDYKINGK